MSNPVAIDPAEVLVSALWEIRQQTRSRLFAAAEVHRAVRAGHREDAATMTPLLERLHDEIAFHATRPEPASAQEIQNEAASILLDMMLPGNSRTIDAIKYGTRLAHELFGDGMQFVTGQPLPEHYLQAALEALRGPAGDWLLGADNPPLDIDVEAPLIDAENRRAKRFAKMSPEERHRALEACRVPAGVAFGAGQETLPAAAPPTDDAESPAADDTGSNGEEEQSEPTEAPPTKPRKAKLKYWAIARENEDTWRLYRRANGQWQDHGKIVIPPGNQTRLAEEFRSRHGFLTRDQAVSLFCEKHLGDSPRTIARKVVTPAMNKLRNAIKDAIGRAGKYTDVGDPLPHVTRPSAWRAEVAFGLAVMSSDDGAGALEFIHSDEQSYLK